MNLILTNDYLTQSKGFLDKSSFVMANGQWHPVGINCAFLYLVYFVTTEVHLYILNSIIVERKFLHTSSRDIIHLFTKYLNFFI